MLALLKRMPRVRVWGCRSLHDVPFVLNKARAMADRGAAMQEELYRAIFERRSVRRFEDVELKEGVLARLKTFTSELRPLFPEIRTDFRIVGPEDVKGLFKVKAPHYLVAFSERKEGGAVNVGFMLQQVDLHLVSIGLGACWQGGPRLTRSSRDGSDLEPVIILAFGIPLKDERRRAATEFDRRPLSEITEIGGHEDILEAARLAPSAMNKQPWFFTSGENGSINTYVIHSSLMERMNQVSAGIALCHMWLAAAHQGLGVGFDREPDETPGPKGYDYVATMIVRHATGALGQEGDGAGPVR